MASVSASLGTGRGVGGREAWPRGGSWGEGLDCLGSERGPEKGAGCWGRGEGRAGRSPGHAEPSSLGLGRAVGRVLPWAGAGI